MIVNRRVGLLATIFALAWLASCGGSSSGGGSSSAGRNAYVAVPEANAIAAYRVDSNSGNLNRVPGLSVSGRHVPNCDRDSSLGKLYLRREPGQQRCFSIQDQPRYRRTCGSHATYSGRIESFGNRTQHGR